MNREPDSPLRNADDSVAIGTTTTGQPDTPERALQARIEQEKQAALYAFAYGASHELNNPLANIVTRAQGLLAEEVHPERRHKLAAIVAQAMRAHEMIADLMLIAKPPLPHPQRLPVGPLLERVVSSVEEWITEREAVVTCTVAPDSGHCLADETQLVVALQALLRNAVEAFTAPGGIVQLQATTEGERICFTVRDNGPGFGAETERHLFDPFYSGREAGRGLGFGLCKARRIAQLHGGDVTATSTPGNGATFCLWLPRTTPPFASSTGGD
jgi:signal transduction histidine kinase